MKAILFCRLRFLSLVVLLAFVRVAVCWGQSQDLYEAFQGGKSGLIDVHGNWVLKPQFDSIKEVEYHYVYFYQNSKLGIANLRGKVLVQPRWEDIWYDEHGLAQASDERGTTIIKVKNGKPISGYYQALDVFAEGLCYVQDSNGRWGAIDVDGILAIPCIYDSLHDMQNGKAQAFLKGSAIFIDKDNRMVEAPEDYYSPSYKSTYHYPVFVQNGYFGAVNRQGDTVFPARYHDLSYADYDNSCTFGRDGKYGVADTLGNVFVAPLYDYLNHFRRRGANIACLKGRWGVIDGQEEVIIPFEYDALHALLPNQYAALVDGKWGILDGVGNWVLEPRFERIRKSFHDDDEEEARAPSAYHTYGRRSCRNAVSYDAKWAGDAWADNEGMAGHSQTPQVSVFPNPTAGRFTISLPAANTASFKLYDSKGAVVLSGHIGDRRYEGNIAAFAPGAYHLVVVCEEQPYEFRLTKQ